MSKTVAIIGYGWLGKHMHSLLPDAYIYDLGLGIGTKKGASKCDIAFIGVPTPNLPDGSLDTSIVESIVEWCGCSLIVIRSTLNPGTIDSFISKYKKRIVVNPEYLGETKFHPFLDPKTRQFLIIGGERKDVRELIDLYTSVYNANITIRQVTAVEAEVIKLSENRAIAFKVAQSQELYDVCERAGVDYYTIRDAVYSDDPRFNLWWTFVFPDNRGMSSKCLPKDLYAWAAWAESLGYDPVISNTILDKNKEWLLASTEQKIRTPGIKNTPFSISLDKEWFEKADKLKGRKMYKTWFHRLLGIITLGRFGHYQIEYKSTNFKEGRYKKY